MKRILFVKHIDIEGPGTLGDFFKRYGYQEITVDLGAGDDLPEDIDRFDAVVVLGGPMNVDEEDKYPFLKKENEFIQQVLKKEIPFLGICLGSQLLAKACRAKVTKSPQKEVGFFDVSLTEDGKKDPLFQRLSQDVLVYQWHEDMFAIPSEAKLLAGSKGCPHQALRVGKNAYGLQFHVEVTDKSIREWSEGYFKKGDLAYTKKAQDMIDDYKNKKKEFHDVGNRIYKNFLEIIETSKR
jgi:GMP synthase-like glutamine amidotransferase